MPPLVRTRWGARGDAEKLSLVHGIAPCTTNDAFLLFVHRGWTFVQDAKSHAPKCQKQEVL